MSTEQSSLHRGRCNCGAFVFEVPEPSFHLFCICKCCQRAGAGVGQWLSPVPRDSVRWVKGSLKELKVYDDKEVDSGNKLYRFFCGECGSNILQSSSSEDPLSLWIAVTALDDPDAYTAHVTMDSASFSHRAPSWMKCTWLHHMPAGVKVERERDVPYRLPPEAR